MNLKEEEDLTKKLNDVMRGCEARSLFYICYLIYENAEKKSCFFILKNIQRICSSPIYQSYFTI